MQTDAYEYSLSNQNKVGLRQLNSETAEILKEQIRVKCNGPIYGNWNINSYLHELRIFGIRYARVVCVEHLLHGTVEFSEIHIVLNIKLE